MKRIPFPTYKGASYALYDAERAYGFGMVLFVSPDGSGPYIQIPDDATGRIHNFAPLEGQTESATVISSPVHVEVGKNIVYAFVDRSGAKHIGDLDSLSLILRDFARCHDDEVAINAQIYELLGTRTERTHSRIQMTNLLGKRSGDMAAKYYYWGSVLNLCFWDVIRKVANDRSSYSNLLMMRRQIGRSLNGALRDLLPDGEWNQIVPLISCPRSSVVAEVRREMERAFADGWIPTRGIGPQGHSAGIIDEIMDDIEACDSEEERLAAILDWIIVSPDATVTFLSSWSDSGRFLTEALKIVRDLFSAGSKGNNRFIRDVMVAHLIPKLAGLPSVGSESELLLSLARRLSYHTFVPEHLEARLTSLPSFKAVGRNDIAAVLRERRPPSRRARAL